MNNSDHRAGVKEANLVKRHLKLSGIDERNIDSLYDEIDQLPGVDSVRIQGARMDVAYDASHCHIDMLEEVVRQHGGRFSDAWWARVKKSYYRFVDQNARDNAAHVPHCCGKVPPGAGK